jgi:ankyrin repeat protein
MRSVVAIRARLSSAALALALLTTPLFIETPQSARGDEKSAAKPLPAELAKAIRDGDLKAVRAQLDGGVDVNVRDANGNTPLLLAAVYAGPECVELLLKRPQIVARQSPERDRRARGLCFGKRRASPLHRG